MNSKESARAKLEEILHSTRGKTVATLDRMDKELQTRTSKVFKAPVIDFDVNGGVTPILDGEKHDMTGHALAGMLTQLKIPRQYVDTLMNDEQKDLLRINLKTRTDQKLKKGALVRSVTRPPERIRESVPGGPDIIIEDPRRLVKGWLSPAYKIMDCVPLLMTFMEECTNIGMLPYNAFNTDYRVKMSFLFDAVVDLGGDYVVFGASFNGGDYGGVADTINIEMLRLVCTNGMTAFDALRKIHAGKRFTGEGDQFMISKETVDKDTATMRSAIRDVVKVIPTQAESLQSMMTEAQKIEVEPARALTMLRKNGLKKEVAERVAAVYEHSDNVTEVPEEKTMYRLSQAIGLVAQDRSVVKTDDEVLDMHRVAFNITGN